MRYSSALKTGFKRSELFRSVEIDEEGRRVTKIDLRAFQPGLPLLYAMPALGEKRREISAHLTPHEANRVLRIVSHQRYGHIVIALRQGGLQACY